MSDSKTRQDSKPARNTKAKGSKTAILTKNIGGIIRGLPANS